MPAQQHGVAPVGERELIRLLERRFGASSSLGSVVRVGIGDDAAVFGSGSSRWVWTVDTNVEGVHFDRRWLSWADVGWRSFHAAVSDLAAMAAQPVAALSSLILPRDLSATQVDQVARGQAAAARGLGCPVIGGNISRGSEFSVTTTAIGRSIKPLLRSGARSGDELWLVGAVGRARAGLLLLQRSERIESAAARRCARAWRRPTALLQGGRDISRSARAALDVSDGLGGDAAQLSAASQVRVVVEEQALRRALPKELRTVAQQLGEDELELALVGGEDYALLCAGPPRKRPASAKRIGRIESGRGAVFERQGGALLPLGGGFDHLSG